MNLLSSKVKTKELDKQIKSLFRIAYTFAYRSFDYNYPVRTPYAMGLSGTPLNETVIALHQILPKFQKEHKLEKVNCVIPAIIPYEAPIIAIPIIKYNIMFLAFVMSSSLPLPII